MTTTDTPNNAPSTDDSATTGAAPAASASNVSAPKGALAGVLAGAAALASGEFVAAAASGRPGPVTAVANRVVDEAPVAVVDFGKAVFGLADKEALIAGTLIISFLLAAFFGVVAARRSFAGGALGIAAFGAVGFWAMAVDARSSATAGFFIALVAASVGIGVLALLLAATRGPIMQDFIAKATAESEGREYVPAVTNGSVSRRTFVGWSGAVAGLAAFGALAAGNLRNRFSATEARAQVQPGTLAIPDDVIDMVAKADASPVAGTAGISPAVVPNDEFYRIDTALLVPQVDPDGWTLTIDGMVDTPLTFTYEDLLERATMTAPVTLSCVSNEIGGSLVGNAIWQGVPLTELLDEAGIDPARATQISSRSVDGWNCGFPTDLAYDGRTAMVAVAMNGEPLPIEHGFPARLVISGLYGYVSATKWLDSITMTTLEDFNGYWIPRGWSKDGPVKTQSRIDTPGRGQAIVAGANTPIAGVAWAPSRGVERVEVQIDEGDWIEADLGEALGIHSWRQWRLDWEATPGDHRIRVRATDGDGVTQTETRTAPAPNGASGWHTINVRV